MIGQRSLQASRVCNGRREDHYRFRYGSVMAKPVIIGSAEIYNGRAKPTLGSPVGFCCSRQVATGSTRIECGRRKVAAGSVKVGRQPPGCPPICRDLQQPALGRRRLALRVAPTPGDLILVVLGLLFLACDRSDFLSWEVVYG